MNDTPNPNMIKMGAATAVGYVLGRTKKGRAGLTLALWLAGGNKYTPKNLVRTGVLTVARHPETAALVSQLRGSLAQAGRQAMRATVEARAASLTTSLQQRTEALSKVGEQGAGAAGKGGKQQDEGPQEEREPAGEQGEQDQRGQQGEQDEQEPEGRGEDTSRQSQRPSGRTPAQRTPQKSSSTEGVKG
ncbi:MAG TPA: hypothetical protein VLC50_03850 [Actinomycetes bacterium]|nr:hypothetical protein [Actinomycetes bacterium]